MFSYQPLWETLTRRALGKSELGRLAGLSPNTIARLTNNQQVSLDSLERICSVLDVELHEVIVRTNKPSGNPGTFAPNKNEPIHRWFPYLEGYSRGLVEDELNTRPDCEVVYDPFGGSGTTPLVAAYKGKYALFSEINPVMRFVAETKLASLSHAARGRIDLHKIACYQDEALKRAKNARSNSSFSLGSFDRFFAPEELASIGDYKEMLADETDPIIQNLMKLALVSIAVPVSKMVRRGDLRFANERELAKQRLPFWCQMSDKLGEVHDDLASMQGRKVGKFDFISADVREAQLSECVDTIVTSPPYLNGTNYFRNTKLELRLLDYIVEESELSGLYQQGITAGINNVSKRRTYDSIDLPLLRSVLVDLAEHSYDQRIPVMVSGYFADMQGAIDRISEALRPGGTLSFDIGDSQFAGVYIPTQEILNYQLEASGLRKVDETVLRTRRSRNGMLLSQRVLRYEKL